MTATRLQQDSRRGSSRPSRSESARVVAVLLAAVAQVVGSPSGSALSGRSDGARSLLTPAGYAFGIWGLVFLGSLAWAVHQALPAQRSRPVHRVTGWPLAAAFAGNAVWETVHPFGGVWQYVTQVLVVAITAVAITAAAVAFAVALLGFVVLNARVAAGPFVTAVVWGLVAIAVVGGPTPVTVAALGAAGVVLVALVARAVSRRVDTGALLVG